MSKAIGLRFVPYDENKHRKNHFFGAPILPKNLLDEFEDEVLFLGMVYLPDVAPFDKEGKLPKEGYLYFFLDTYESSRKMKPIVIHFLEDPHYIVDDFNKALSKHGFPGIDKPRGVEFVEVDEDDEGCKLLGVPCDWNYQSKPVHPLLLQLSHFDEELNFLPELDGYTYVFFGPKGKDFEQAEGFYEYS